MPDRILTLGGADGRLCSVECGGWLRATNGGILQFANAQVDLANGELVADGGIVEIAGGSVSSGRITATNGGHVRVTGGCNLTQVTNHAPVRLMGGMGQATVGGGSLVNHGLITVNYNSGTNCTLNFSPAATLTGTGRLLLNNGRLAGSTLTVGSAQSVGGTGTIAAPYVNAGMLFVGNGIGRLDFEAPLVLQPTSRLQFDLGGSVQGVTHDFLASTHSIELNGVLEVTVHAGLQAALKPADTFRILQSGGGVTGTFTNLLPGGRVQTNFGTCLVLIDSTGVSLTDFRGGIPWAERHFAPAEQADPAVAGDTADPNSNGLPNLAEYAMGLDPKSRDRGRLPAVAAADGHVAITYQRSRAATDVVITVQESMDLLQWAEATVFETILASDEATETVTARVAVGAGARKFLRLSVKRP